MRVYHFLNREIGLKVMRERRLKISSFEAVNDPFELYPICADADERRRFRAARKDMAKVVGLLCFSADWHNPVQWSHYADKHFGICLGFDIPDYALSKVKYRRQRIKADWAAISGPTQESQAELKRWFTTKFSHWSYEQEWRAFLILANFEPDADGRRWVEFDHETRLAEVIIGDRSDLTGPEVDLELGDLAPDVDVFKARLAFQSYNVVKQRSKAMWCRTSDTVGRQ